MKIGLRVIFFAALVALGVWIWTILFPSPEKIIHQQLTKLAQDVSFSQNEGNFARLAAAHNIAGFFSTNAEVNVALPGRERYAFVGRDEIMQAALAARSGDGELGVKFSDVNITVAPDKQSATANVTVEMNISGERAPIVQEMKFAFEKLDGKWLIKKVETLRTLSILNFNLCALVS